MNRSTAMAMRTVTVLLPALCLLALLVGYTWQQQHMRKSVIAYLQKQTDIQGEKIDEYIAQNKENVAKLANNNSFQQLLLLQDSPEKKRQLNFLLSQTNSSFKFDDIFIVSKQQEILFQLSDNKKTSLTQREKKLFQETITLMDTTISKLGQDSADQEAHALLATPVVLQRRLAGVVMVSMGSEGIHKIITHREQNNPYPFEVVLAFSENQQLHILYSTGKLFGLRASERIMNMSSPQTQQLQQALHGKQGAGNSTDRLGTPTLAAWKYLPYVNLAMLATLQQQSLFSSTRNAYLLAAALVLLLDLIFVFVARRKNGSHELCRYSYAPHNNWHQQAKWSLNGFLWLSIVIAASNTGFFGYRLIATQNQLHDRLDQEARVKVQQASQLLDNRINNMKNLGDSVAADLQSGRLKAQDISVRLKRIVKEQPEIFGIGVAYSPYSYKPNIRLYAPYMKRDGQNIVSVLVEDVYDYTLPQSLGRPKTDWYNKPMSANKAMWMAPYFGSASQKFISSYVTPFYRANDQDKKNPIGTIEVMQDLSSLHNLVSNFNMHGTGYNFIIDKKGTYIYHPIARYIKQQISIQDIAAENLTAVADLANNIAQAESSNKISMYGDGPSWVYTKYIPGTDWIFGIAFEESDLHASNNSLKFFITMILISMFILTLLVTSLLLQNLTASIDRAATYFAIFTGSALLTLVGFWSYMLLEPSRVQLQHSTPILERFEIDRYVTSFRKARAENLSVLAIPTGIMLEDIQFIDFKHATISGYCWQKYPIGANLRQGVVISNAVDSDFQEVYREPKGDFEVVGWEFTATITQHNNPWRYPFDNQNISIALENSDLNANVILTPDADSYDLLHPTSVPGIARGLLQSVSIQKSFFSYSEQKPKNRLGLDENSHLIYIPNLVYSVAIKRGIVDPIVFYVIPLITVLICIYLLFMMQHKIARGDLAGAYLALLFTIVLLHQILRTQLQTDTMLYIEHFFLTSYIMILVVFSNIFLVAKDPPTQWSTRFLRLIFWPGILTAWIVSTVYVFLQ
ncbi:MAG: hypothetical protein AAF310_02550 [Myxococcota bacterium]